MAGPRYGGSIVAWVEADGFGEIETPGHAPLVVRPHARRAENVVRGRNFGFIKPDTGNKDIFVGEAAFRASDIVPQQGERYTFVIDRDRHDRPRATNLAYEGAKKGGVQDL
jgi:cold shock CspA family protein